MEDNEDFTTLPSVLEWARRTGQRLRFYGRGMTIMAEGLIASASEELVALKHRENQEAEEFLMLSEIAKVQTLEEMYQT
ncbi:hypothetical protein EU524_02085 [Candidatus Thorarchaeota archaeon]|nr:MAG: hypothetical protein EU524_02085 [Candidatus Thorarchaeota archaeon]